MRYPLDGNGSLSDCKMKYFPVGWKAWLAQTEARQEKINWDLKVTQAVKKLICIELYWHNLNTLN